MASSSRPTGHVSNAERDLTDTRAPTHADRPEHVAPDGQRVVDESSEIAEQRRTIQDNADRLEVASRAEGAREPSVRFWHSRRAQAGPILALVAALFTLAVRTWPIVTPQGRGSVGIAWFVTASLVGALYIAGFFLSDRHWRSARLVLVCGALLHVFISILAATVVDIEGVAPAPLTMVFDAVPALMALVAAFLIGPPPGERASRR